MEKVYLDKTMTEFVLDQYEADKGVSAFENDCYSYANFLSKKLSIEQFVPCKSVDGVWVVLEEPNPISIGKCINKRKRIYEPVYDDKEIQEYQEAKKRCIFEGFEVTVNDAELKRIYLKDTLYITFYSEGSIVLQSPYVSSVNIETIESLIKYKPEITQTSVKQLNL